MYTVTEYADIMLAQRISMVGGVSRVQVMGEQKYAVRVQVDPDKLAAHNIGIDEVQRAIAASNSNLPTGQLNGEKQAFTIESSGTLAKAADYRPIIVAWRNGTPVRLEQLANVIDSVENNKLIAWMNNVRCVMLESTGSRGRTRWKWWTTSAGCCRNSSGSFRRRCAWRWCTTRRNRSATRFATWSSPCC